MPNHPNIMKKTFFLISAALILFSGCGKEDFYIPFCKPDKYFPLEVGNYWIFQNYKVYADGTVEQESCDSMYISSDTLRLGYRYFHLEGTFHMKKMDIYLTYANDQVVTDADYVFLECPRLVQTDKQYRIMDFDFPGPIKTTSQDTLIKVPAGEFNPVMLFEAHSMLDDTLWIVTYKAYYAKNVGMVKFSAKQHPVYDCENFCELVRYHIED